MSDYQGLINGIIATPEAAVNLLNSSKVSAADKQILIRAMIMFGTGAYIWNYHRNHFMPTDKFYKSVQGDMLANFNSVLIESLKHSNDVLWIFDTCAQESEAVKPAYLCRLICRLLDITGKGVAPDRARRIIADISSNILGLPAFLKEPEFADVLNHRNASQDTLPSNFLNVKEGMEFAKRLEAKPQTTPAQAAKTLINYPEIVAQCIDSMAEAAQCQEVQECQIPF